MKIYHDSSSRIVHNGANSLYISAEGAGEDIYIQANDDIYIQPSTDEDGIKVFGEGGIDLYYDNVKKFETESWGCQNHGVFKTDDDLYPTADNDGVNCGLGNRRWDTVYAVNGTIDTSDRNEKNTILESDLGLDFINKLKPVSFKWNNNDDKTHYGLIAQDLEETLSTEGKTLKDFAALDKQPDSPMGLNYSGLVSPLIKAIQELTTEVETLKTKVAALEAK